MDIDLSEITAPENLYWPPEDLPRILGRIPRLAATVLPIGKSREGRPFFGVRVGRGSTKVSIIAGAHADEPVGPAALLGLIRWLISAPAAKPLLEKATFFLCPHINPDGAHRNAEWIAKFPCPVEEYLQAAVRELPGDDVEFGFPLDPQITSRPENRGVAEFLKPQGPLTYHASLHGMAIAEGAWFLINESRVADTGPLRRDLAAFCKAKKTSLHDWDRHGEKGFTRIEKGFCTTPTAAAMKAHFVQVGESATAAKFLPSSMELAASLGGDPLAMVSEMPLYRIKPSPPNSDPPGKNFLELKKRLMSARMELSSGNVEPLKKLKETFDLKPVSVGVSIEIILAMILLGSGLVSLEDILSGGRTG